MTLIDDFRHALHGLRAHPGTMTFATVTLACGLAAALAILAVVDAVLLRALPYPNAERIVQINELADDGRTMNLAKPNYDDLAASVPAMPQTSFYQAFPATIGIDREAVRAPVAIAGGDFFSIFGTAPLAGRTFGADERVPVAVIGEAFWRGRLDARADVVGSVVEVDGARYTVVGVMPEGFAFPADTALWLPTTETDFGTSRTAHNWRGIGLLTAPGALAEARLSANVLATRLHDQYRDEVNLRAFSLLPLGEAIAAPVRSALLVLAGGTAFLLLIAVSNAVNLLLALGAARAREFAVRRALGASRWRLARQHFLEALLIAAVAACAGLVLAAFAIDVLVHLAGRTLPRAAEIGIAPSTIGFAAVGALAIALALTAAQSIGGERAPLIALREAGRGTTGGRGHLRARTSLLVAQTALTTVLLVGAGLLGRSFLALLAIDPGFSTEGAVSVRLSYPASRDADALRAMAQRYAALTDALAALPGVARVGGVNALPLTGGGANGAFWDGAMTDFSGPIPPQLGYAEFRAASAGYFEAAGIPVLAGRAFDARDRADGAHVALISATVAKETWPGRDPIGQRIQVGNMDGDMTPVTVIGVVGDVHEQRLERAPMGAVYVDVAQRPMVATEFNLIVRTTLPLAAIVPTLREAVDRLAPDLPHSLQPLAELRVQAMAQRRFNLVLLGSFGVVALLLAGTGLYGLMAFAVAQRRGEFALRQALGASSNGILRLVLRSGFVVAAIGIAIGIAAAVAGSRLVASLIYGVPATDPVTLAAVGVGLLAVLLLAGLIPARRACRVLPREALA